MTNDEVVKLVEEAFNAWAGHPNANAGDEKRASEALGVIKAALTRLPEDVARLAAQVQVEDGLPAFEAICAAAARVSGLEEENLDLRESREMAEKAEARIEALLSEIETAESERDAARQEVEALKEERGQMVDGIKLAERRVSDLLEEAQTLREQVSTLTAQAAELERERGEDKEKLRLSAEQTTRLEREATSAYATANSERASREAAEARATAAEAEVTELAAVLKDAHAAMEHMGDTLNAMEAVDAEDPKDASAIAAYERVNAFMEGKPTPTPAGLREAVAEALESFDDAKGLAAWDEEQGMVNLSEDMEKLRNRLAAYDATPEPSVTHADLAAVAREVADEDNTGREPEGSAMAEAHSDGWTTGALEVVRRATGGEVPKKSVCADCVATTKDAEAWKKKAAKWDAAVERAKDIPALAKVAWAGWRAHTGPGGFVEAEATAVARYVLGLDTPPSGPGGGERVPPVPLTPESKAKAQNAIASLRARTGANPPASPDGSESRHPRVTPEGPALAEIPTVPGDEYLNTPPGTVVRVVGEVTDGGHTHLLRLLVCRHDDGTEQPVLEVAEGGEYAGRRYYSVSSAVHALLNLGEVEVFQVGNREGAPRQPWTAQPQPDAPEDKENRS